MEISLAEAAVRLEVSNRRARQLAEAGLIEARKVGGIWLVDEENLRPRGVTSRPMARDNAWGLVHFMEPKGRDDLQKVAHLSPHNRSRFKAQAAQVESASRPEMLLMSWLAKRADSWRCNIAVPDIKALIADPRIVVSGLSDSRSGMAVAGEAEFYCRTSDKAALTDEYWLSSKGRPNVFAHVVEDHLMPTAPVPVPLLAADLADHGGPRELKRARELLAAVR